MSPTAGNDQMSEHNMSLHEIHALHKRHLHDNTRYSVVVLRAALKRSILSGYRYRLLSIRSTQKLIDVLHLWSA